MELPGRHLPLIAEVPRLDVPRQVGREFLTGCRTLGLTRCRRPLRRARRLRDWAVPDRRTLLRSRLLRRSPLLRPLLLARRGPGLSCRALFRRRALRRRRPLLGALGGGSKPLAKGRSRSAGCASSGEFAEPAVATTLL
jgi:hypothetical protein